MAEKLILLQQLMINACTIINFKSSRLIECFYSLPSHLCFCRSVTLSLQTCLHPKHRQELSLSSATQPPTSAPTSGMHAKTHPSRTPHSLLSSRGAPVGNPTPPSHPTSPTYGRQRQTSALHSAASQATSHRAMMGSQFRWRTMEHWLPRVVSASRD